MCEDIEQECGDFQCTACEETFYEYELNEDGSCPMCGNDEIKNIERTGLYKSGVAQVKKLTRQQAIVVSGYTGILACDINELKRDVSERLNMTCMSHHLATKEESIKLAYKDDFIAMSNMTREDEITGDPYEENQTILQNTDFDLEEIEKIRSAGFKFKIEITRDSSEPLYINVDVGYYVNEFVGETRFVSVPKSMLKSLIS